MFQENRCGAVQGRAPGHLTHADLLDPAALDKRADDVGAHGDTANLFDLPARDRLAIGDDGERLQQRARVTRRTLFEQLGDVIGVLRARLDAPALADLLELDAALGVVGFDMLQYRAQLLFRRL